jgi:putative PEP-CTERM system histidine kinase
MELLFYGMTAIVSLLGGIVILSRSGTHHGRAIALGLLLIALLETCYMVFYLRTSLLALQTASLLELAAISSFMVSVISMEKGILKKTRLINWMRRSFVLICILYSAALLSYPEEYARLNLQDTVVLRGLGKLQSILIFTGSVLFIWFMENILRSSQGSNRRILKYPALGSISVGASLCLASIYRLSTHTITHEVLILCTLITLVGISALIFFSIRFKLFEMDIFVSRYVVYHSITFISIGSYLILTGLIILGIQKLGIELSFVITGFIVFVALLLLSVFTLSPEAKARLKFFINTHFFSNKYDYRKEWGDLSGYLSIAFNENQIIHLTSQVILDSMYIKELAIWLMQGTIFRRAFSFPDLAGDTTISAEIPLISYLKNNPYFMRRTPSKTNDTSWEEMTHGLSTFLDRNKIELAVGMMAGNMLIGFITVGKENPGTPYGQDDIDLLTAVASQSSAALMSAWYAQRFAENKELDTYNRMSASILHDLKNAAGHLSLILQNAPRHMDDAEFRRDMLETISQALGRIDKVMGKLTAVPEREKLKVRSIPVQSFLEKLLGRLNPRFQRIELIQKTEKNMEINSDPDVLENILENIIVNATEAVKEDDGRIAVTAYRRDGTVVFSVADNGEGMTEEFIRDKLFKPFQTTKKMGTGLGLWLVKNMADQLGARIHVTQNPDCGVTFTVTLEERSATGNKGTTNGTQDV